MRLNPLYHLVDAWERSAERSRTKRRERWEARRAKATAAWYARLPAARQLEKMYKPVTIASGVHPQSDSFFFGRLPVELRSLIYADILIGKELRFQVINETRNNINDTEIGKEKIPFDLACPAGRGLLSFPLSCKLAYMETFHHVYASNTFRLTGVTEFFCLARLLHRKNLDLIQTLHIQYSYIGTEVERGRDLNVGIPPFRMDYWEEAWHGISQMKGLKNIRVDLHKFDSRSACQEELFYYPMQNLADRVKIEVFVTWPKEMHEPPDKEIWPFEISRCSRFYEEGNGTFHLVPPCLN